QGSTNGGSTWSTLQSFNGASQGAASNFQSVIINLSAAYANQPNVRFRFNYVSDWGYYWAVDDFSVSGQAPVAQFAWTSDTGSPVDGLDAGTGTFSVNNDTVHVHPTGTTLYTMTVKDPATACTASSTATVTVN